MAFCVLGGRLRRDKMAPCKFADPTREREVIPKGVARGVGMQRPWPAVAVFSMFKLVPDEYINAQNGRTPRLRCAERCSRTTGGWRCRLVHMARQECAGLQTRSKDCKDLRCGVMTWTSLYGWASAWEATGKQAELPMFHACTSMSCL